MENELDMLFMRRYDPLVAESITSTAQKILDSMLVKFDTNLKFYRNQHNSVDEPSKGMYNSHIETNLTKGTTSCIHTN